MRKAQELVDYNKHHKQKTCDVATIPPWLVLKSACRLAVTMEHSGVVYMHNFKYCKRFPWLGALLVLERDHKGLEYNPVCGKPYYQPDWVDGFGEQFEYVEAGAEVPAHYVCASNRPSACVDAKLRQEIIWSILSLPIATDASQDEIYAARRDQHHALLLRQYRAALLHYFSFDYNRSDMDALVLPTIQYLERHPEIFVSAERHEQRHADLPEENKWLDFDMHMLDCFQDDVQEDA